ncbi:bifunctional tRNA (5-methylaminomethyl-2-thiouridine)(34)-methyltransferase MnmD/FAD-dependent 5-carboxymethylaminomethyl-2-thiouridine(34) oxidoreductase MnmC [Grimontia sp. NTOU-MAR1]|uniref:bifunctional tRNA (5-methylaminomethyl-2-thiouridine)(34)-methyltransferase MnmD/FAD-dependent 5-carboxymethylaminomethyl-2-thiouridine(34) oxidoreductase MnmC n=1 Tax=Grimontia sp. NTOU-MAR1 TaxID=3111011 RepID=UPI002DB91A6D|nr:bifunctional tRNA (5-methylaminomethyl-2-thiouridine)(34)-methyltransferase MnmD/FAD-dependent 5-carboxymethylaminomethyl-2-thiouridine(34) oxidoreductase MnmC [Grimontia sp. NTOU-MAR1]WRV97492.1 bifunctional tRNA (5-methylaminomethyl-2-thiouridine)(34)-methyltransferase MnmD/FAD-dependent 5-carboxymethylaminomethyl-2-thiouridine(34) oxidoreductase MnmC [Grimontia sp. NTOU-MAR1]
MTQTRIEHAQIHWNDAGTPVSDNFDDVYFSNANGLEETRYVFLQQNQLPNRWDTFSHDRFVIAETGFGTGLNFLAVWQWFAQFRKENPEAQVNQLHFISFEKFPVSVTDLEKAHAAWPELADFAEALRKHYPAAVSGCHRLLLADGMITLDLWFGDIKDCMPQVWTSDDGIVDCWFLDGFAPSKNPEMWSQTLFDGMARLAKQDCTVATFTAAGFVRRGLIDAGFEMKKAKGYGTKRDMIVGTMVERNQQRQQAPWYKRTAPQNSNDIAIIGGGVASATLALSLVRRGKSVTLYCEHDKPGLAASGNRQGAVYPLLNGSDDALSRFFAPAFLFSRQFIEQAAETVSFNHDLCGVTQLGWDEKSTDKLAKMLTGGFPESLIHGITREDAESLTGIETGHGGVTYPLGGWLCPQQLTQGLIANAEETGLLTCHYSTEVTKASHQNGAWILTANQSERTHDTVVVANGHKFTQFEQTAPIPAYAVRGQVSHINTTPALKQLKTVLCYDGYLTPANPKNDTHCIGASYSRNDTSMDFRMDDQADNKQRLVDCIPAEWPKEIDTDHGGGRVGIRCASRDHLPYVGDVCDFEALKTVYSDLRDKKDNTEDVPVYPNLYSLLALGSRGLTSAPILGELLASQLCGDPLPMPVDVLNALHPGRMWVRKLLKGKAL